MSRLEAPDLLSCTARHGAGHLDILLKEEELIFEGLAASSLKGRKAGVRLLDTRPQRRGVHAGVWFPDSTLYHEKAIRYR